MDETDQKKVWEKVTSISMVIMEHSRIARTAAFNFLLGIERYFSPATLDFAEMKATEMPRRPVKPHDISYRCEA